MTGHATPKARRFAGILFLVTGLLVAAPAFAGGGSTGDLEVGVFGGMLSPDDYVPLNPDGGTLYGFRIGYAITDAWSVEGSWQEASGLDGEYLGTDTDVDFEAIRFNFLYNFRAGKPFRWFLTGGVGEESVDADDVPMHEVGLGVNAGAGVRGFFGEKKRFSLRGTARVVYTDPGGG
ncbi:MAG TPA: outer membrane beta-barrel protein, partial [Candidatus Polarisedimenticolia bacterium]|nr:outer membrane beta-barrel protein [Candidatus Polarisedimenticolia bacterium]